MSVLYYSEPKNDFSDLYIQVRRKENRLYTEEEIKNLPFVAKNHPHYAEWKLRERSTARFIKYLKSKNKPLRILEIGCGNGWFANILSGIEQSEVVGLDVNPTELEQANKAFQKENLTFVYADLFEKTQLNEQKFDIIAFNSCLQYFNDLPKLFKVCKALLTQNGEIHIVDTPFYNSNEMELAKKRSEAYYKDLGFPEMAQHYFHHRFDNLGDYTIMYKPSLLGYFKKDSPFCWLLLKNK